MCEADLDQQLFDNPTQRRKIWEMNPGWHCSIVGTCLSVGELRALGKKLSLKVSRSVSRDYQLHGFFSKNAENQDRPAKMLYKLLDRKHQVTIRKLRAVKCEQELTDFWAAAQEAGDIPGPYWAILSHPKATADLAERMYTEVHMLSHLVGASNRADIRRLSALEEKMTALEEILSKKNQHYQNRLREKERQNSDLVAKLVQLPRSAAASPKQSTSAEVEFADATNAKLMDELTRLKTEGTQKAATIREHNDQIENLNRLVQKLREENRSLEMALSYNWPASSIERPFDLGGRCLLYVGGRQQTVHRLKSLVETWNGEFVHHDGGLERSLDELAPAVVKADAVMFPTDCGSHSAMLKIKRLCRQTMKPYVPLRSSGVASFVAGLQSRLADIHITGDVQ